METCQAHTPLEVGARPGGPPAATTGAGPRGCSRGAAPVSLAVLGTLLLASVVGFCLHLFLFCEQQRDDVRCTLKEGAKSRTHDVFTVIQDGDYVIYGWVRLAEEAADAKLSLMQTYKGQQRVLSKNTSDEDVIFFSTRASLIKEIHVSAHCDFPFVESACHVRRLS